MVKGEIWWAQLPYPRGSEPAKRRPVLVIQGDAFLWFQNRCLKKSMNV
jgi:mRNA interferase MazF